MPLDRAGDTATDVVRHGRAQRRARGELADVELQLQPLLLAAPLARQAGRP